MNEAAAKLSAQLAARNSETIFYTATNGDHMSGLIANNEAGGNLHL